MQDIDSLSTSLEGFSIFNTRPPPLENHQVLTKNDKICFKRKDNNEQKTATLISRSGKATDKYKKASNSKLDDRTMKSSDYEREVNSLEQLRKSTTNNNNVNLMPLSRLARVNNFCSNLILLFLLIEWSSLLNSYHSKSLFMHSSTISLVKPSSFSQLVQLP